MNTLLCFFGFHKWEYYNEHISSIDKSIICKNRSCVNCGRKEERAYDFWQPFWAKL